MIYDFKKELHCENAKMRLSYLIKKQKKIEIKEIRQLKTLSQVKYAWLVFTHVAFETGSFKDEQYAFCLQKFALRDYLTVNGMEFTKIKTMSKMDKMQLSKFIDSFVIFYRMEGFDVPDPDDLKALQTFEFYQDHGMI